MDPLRGSLSSVGMKCYGPVMPELLLSRYDRWDAVHRCCGRCGVLDQFIKDTYENVIKGPKKVSLNID